MKNRKIRISVADKGGAVIVQDTSAYVAEIEKQLTNERHYLRIKNDPTSQIAKVSNTLVHDLFDAKRMTEETCNMQHATRNMQHATCNMQREIVEPNAVQCHKCTPQNSQDAHQPPWETDRSPTPLGDRSVWG